MSFLDCITSNPALSPRQAEKLADEYSELFNRYRGTMGDDIAAAAAAQKYVEIAEKVIRKKNENAIRDVLAYDRINARLGKVADRVKSQKEEAGRLGFFWGKSNAATATRAFLENVYTRQQALERRATLAIAEAVEKYRSKLAGATQDTKGFVSVVRELFGEKTGDTGAASDGKAIRDVFDMLHKMYEQAGGILGKLDNYFPQTHNPVLVGRAGYTKWKEFIAPLLDRDRMIDPMTGLPLSDSRLELALKEAFEGIRTNGLNDVRLRADEGKQRFGTGGGAALRHSSSRFFHFRDADSYLKYATEFGYGEAGLFQAVMGHIHSMTRDIAIMQDMGPNPGGQIERLKMRIEADGAGPQAVRTVAGMYDVLSGRTSYHGELPSWYRAVRGLQDWLRSAYLGAAPVSAMSDSFFAAYTAKLNGVPAARVMGSYFKLLNPASDADRRIARRIGFIAGAANGTSLANARFQDDIGSRGLTGWLASFTNRASGLAAMTDGVRQSIALGTQGFFAEARSMKLKYDDLPDAMKEAFQRWDIAPEDYRNIISSQPHTDPDTEADFLRPEDVAAAGHRESATKYELWLVDMAQDASNEPRLLTRSIATGAVLGDAREGTTLRAGASSVMMFKSFGITVILNHLLPSLRYAAAGRGGDRLSRIAPLIIGTTILGGAAMQARQIIQGKEARDINKEFVGAAMMQGGGFGIFGDFLFKDYSRFNQSFLATLGGPVLGFANDAVRVFKGNFDKALDDDQETKFIADFSQFASRNIPAVKLWYTRLLLERLALDGIQRSVDPNFDDRMRRIEGKMKKEYGQDYWWAPGRKPAL